MVKAFKYCPLNYGDDKINVNFSVADENSVIQIVKNINFIDSVELIKHGFCVKIAIQQIPEIVRELCENNVAIYAIIPE